MQIERGSETDAATHRLEELERQWIKKYNLSRENISKMLQDYDKIRENEAKPEWSFFNSVYFVLQLVTTIGYGNITPKTSSGQLLTIAYALAGIPLTVLALKSVGQLVNIVLKDINRPLHKLVHTIHCDERLCNFLESGNVCINAVCCILTWTIVTAISAHLEPERSLVPAIYSIFVTYSTVGFGDIIPFEDRKYIFMVIVLPGLCFMSSLIDSVVAWIEKSNVACKRCFNFSKCFPVKRDMRIQADGVEEPTEDDNKTPSDQDRASSVRTSS